MKRTAIKVKFVRNKALKARVKARDGGFCAKCGDYDAQWHHDHIVPLSIGGQDTLDNSQTLCRRCHEAKTSPETTRRAKADRLRERDQLTKRRKPVRSAALAVRTNA